MLVEDDVKDQATSNKDLEIYLRREKVWDLYRQGFKQEQIARKLNVSPKTISRDFTALKNESIEWMETLPDGEIQLLYRTNYESIDQVIQELHKIFENTDDVYLKVKILNEIAAKKKMQSDMLDSKKLLKVREIMINERDFKSHYGRTPHHIDPHVALLTKIGQNS